MGEVRPLEKVCTCVYQDMTLGCCQDILLPTLSQLPLKLPYPSTKLRLLLG
jgi:hypothetical protein